MAEVGFKPGYSLGPQSLAPLKPHCEHGCHCSEAKGQGLRSSLTRGVL